MGKLKFPIEIKKVLQPKRTFNKQVFKVVIVFLLLFYIHQFSQKYINLHKKNLNDILFFKKVYTFLLVGTDKKIGVNRTDTIILVFWDLRKHQITFLSLPRDTRVLVDKHGFRKINSAYAYFSRKNPVNGIKHLINSIKTFLDVKIDYYLLIDLQAFVNIIDIIGGVELDVTRNMHYEDKAGGLRIDIQKGLQVLDGEKAMEYVRYREKIYGDLGRVKRQQKFIRSIIKKLKSSAVWFNLHKIISQIYKNVYTNIPLYMAFSFGKEILNLKKYKIVFGMLPGKPAYINRVSYYLIDYEKLDKFIHKVLAVSSTKLKSQKQKRGKEND